MELYKYVNGIFLASQKVEELKGIVESLERIDMKSTEVEEEKLIHIIKLSTALFVSDYSQMSYVLKQYTPDSLLNKTGRDALKQDVLYLMGKYLSIKYHRQFETSTIDDWYSFAYLKRDFDGDLKCKYIKVVFEECEERYIQSILKYAFFKRAETVQFFLFGEKDWFTKYKVSHTIEFFIALIENRNNVEFERIYQGIERIVNKHFYITTESKLRKH